MLLTSQINVHNETVEFLNLRIKTGKSYAKKRIFGLFSCKF
jgi:hypothetical protein